MVSFYFKGYLTLKVDGTISLGVCKPKAISMATMDTMAISTEKSLIRDRT